MRPPLKPPRRLLVRGVNWLGDAVMTTPALQRLRQALPDCHIILLTRDKLAGLWQYHPSLNGVLQSSPDESVLTVASRIRASKVDTALIFPNSPRAALETWLAGVPERIGYARPWRNFCLTRPIPERPGAVKMKKPSTEDIQKLLSTPAPHPPASPILKMSHQCHDY